jgi:hypothetical protein
LKFIKCCFGGCRNYIDEHDAKFIKYNEVVIPICESCDDGTYEEVFKEYHDTFKKVEKIKKSKTSFYE